MADSNTDDKSTGGMTSKLYAAKSATEAGIPTLIGPGYVTDVLLKHFNKGNIGTKFKARSKR